MNSIDLSIIEIQDLQNQVGGDLQTNNLDFSALKNLVQKGFRALENDQLIGVLAKNTTSQNFIEDRIVEIFNETSKGELTKEIVDYKMQLSKQREKCSQLYEETQFLRRKNQKLEIDLNEKIQSLTHLTKENNTQKSQIGQFSQEDSNNVSQFFLK